jgi:hypothetical protein
MQGTITQTFESLSRGIPILRMLLSIRPFRCISSIEKKGRLSSIVSQPLGSQSQQYFFWGVSVLAKMTGEAVMGGNASHYS